MIAMEYARFGLGLLAFYLIASLFGDTEEDSRSSDFGKIRRGNVRLDPLMGLQQFVVFGSRIMTGEEKRLDGRILSLRGVDKKWGTKDVADVLFNFGRTKVSPQLGFVLDYAIGRTMDNKETTLQTTLPRFAIPITYGDVYSVMQQDGYEEGVIVSTLAMLGMGLQVYDNDKKSYAKKSVKLY